MKYGFLAYFMWIIFTPTFKKHLYILDVKNDNNLIMKKAKVQYKDIIKSIQPFGKNDILLVNLLSGAQIAAIYISLDKKPSCEQMKEFYSKAMDNSKFMRIFLKSTNYYSKGYQNKLNRQAKISQNSDNPYSWRFNYYKGSTIVNFDAIFDRCGICHLFQELNISEITPALCAYDYGMAKWTNTELTRETTIASGGRVCDCRYKKQLNNNS